MVVHVVEVWRGGWDSMRMYGLQINMPIPSWSINTNTNRSSPSRTTSRHLIHRHQHFLSSTSFGLFFLSSSEFLHSLSFLPSFPTFLLQFVTDHYLLRIKNPRSNSHLSFSFCLFVSLTCIIQLKFTHLINLAAHHSPLQRHPSTPSFHA